MGKCSNNKNMKKAKPEPGQNPIIFTKERIDSLTMAIEEWTEKHRTLIINSIARKNSLCDQLSRAKVKLDLLTSPNSPKVTSLVRYQITGIVLSKVISLATGGNMDEVRQYLKLSGLTITDEVFKEICCDIASEIKRKEAIKISRIERLRETPETRAARKATRLEDAAKAARNKADALLAKEGDPIEAGPLPRGEVKVNDMNKMQSLATKIITDIEQSSNTISGEQKIHLSNNKNNPVPNTKPKVTATSDEEFGSL